MSGVENLSVSANTQASKTRSISVFMKYTKRLRTENARIHTHTHTHTHKHTPTHTHARTRTLGRVSTDITNTIKYIQGL